MDKSKLNEILELHIKWLNGDKDGQKAILRDADLEGADLTGAILKGAILKGADLDFSCFPLWCGGLRVHLDDKQVIQLLYHTVQNAMYSKNTSERVKNILNSVVDLANEFHRVEECGKVEKYVRN